MPPLSHVDDPRISDVELGRVMLDDLTLRAVEVDIGRAVSGTVVGAERYRRERPRWLRDRMLRVRER